ncbi:unnamed protein product [Oikopleura dioica]|uniref:Uncharacterized protein n=1 Tax=Oikopleura dioica TaxID=34765 RepID=E4YKJ3_OIKDI|nr:unnamed protein product [Oikopleura dioica]
MISCQLRQCSRSSFIFSKMKAKGAMDSDELPSDPKQTETSRLVPTWTPDAYSSPKSSKYVLEVGSFHVKAIFLFFFILLPVGVSMFGSGYLHNCQIHLPNQVQTVYAAQTSATPLAGISPNSNSLGGWGRRRRSADDSEDEDEFISSVNLCSGVWMPVFGFYLSALLISTLLMWIFRLICIFLSNHRSYACLIAQNQ